MPTIPTIQPSFAAGELSPFLYGRVDLAKFHIGARTMSNFFVHPHGGASNRPGTRFVGAVDDGTVRHRLIPFQFRASPAGQNYALVFGHLTMQVVMLNNGAPGFVLNNDGVTIYTLATPYAAADLALLKFVQSADTMTLTHPSYAPRQLTRTAHNNWTLTTITFAPSTAAPTGLASSAPGGGPFIEVTAINDSTGEESLPSSPASGSTGTDSWTWTAVPGCSNYNVYKRSGSIYGFVAQVQTNAWTDAAIQSDIGNTPPGSRNPFSGGAGFWPGCTTYYQQRQIFANSTTFPQTLWFSNTGAFNNMNVSEPTKDTDAITRALTGRQVNEIRHLVECGNSLLIMTSGAEWRCWPGNNATGLTPGSCFTLPQTSHGCNNLAPIWTENALLFVKERGNKVIELRFDVLQDQWQATDRSVLSQHLVYDTAGQFQLQEWAFAEEPFKIVWAVRSDGALLGFTYMREHDVYAWHRHSTQGTVESVCSIPEPDGSGGLFDAVYLIVNRTINGTTKRYVERMAPRTWASVSDMWFLDCALQYSGAPVTSVSGLNHLVGQTVAILGDGSVVPSQVVDNTGTVQLDGSYSKVTVGLAYEADLETLNLELPTGGGTVQGQMKKIAQCTLRVKDARGVQVGLNQTLVTGGTAGAQVEVKQRQSEFLGTAMQVFQGDWNIAIPTEWNRDGRLFVKQTYPLPVTILDLMPQVNLGA
ncbi:MAG TPA: hypothetical protein VFB13_01990 [Reyranella sp.]|nr:hypothetical protein [Reyranella sp.]